MFQIILNAIKSVYTMRIDIIAFNRKKEAQ